MKTSVEKLDEVSVRLTVEVEPERVKRAFDHAARELAKQVNLPGFRPGKAPRRILEQRLGEGAIAQAAMENSISDYYVEALREQELNPVAQPELDVDRFDEAEGCAFTATVEVRPEFEAPDHTGINVSFPDWEVAESAIEEHLEGLRDRFAEVDEVDRPAETGDLVTVDLEVEVDGQVIEQARVSDALYEVGSGGVTPKLDDLLVGAVAGADVEFEDTLPEGFPEHGGREATLRVHVTDVRAKTLPELDDDFATTASSFDTIAELRADVRRSMERRRVLEAQQHLRSQVLEAYLARAEVTLPPAMIEGEVQERLHQLEHQAEQFGMDVEQLLELQGTDRETFERQAREQATGAVRARIVLDQLANQLEVRIEPSDIEAEIVRHAQQNQMQPEEIARIIQEQGSLPALVGDIMRRRAIDAVVDASTIDGEPSEEVLRNLDILPSDDEEAEDEAAPGLIVPGQEPGDAGDAGEDAPRIIVPGQ